MKTMMSILIAVLFVSLVQEADAQSSVWERLEFFRGNWKGHETGKSGIGVGTRSYSYILGDRYLLSKNQSSFEPQELNPKGEIHQDWMVFSHDKGRRTLVGRQFNSEGFVNTFVLDTLVSGDDKLVFVSESSENAPPGLRARLTFHLKNEREFIEVFDLAFPDKGFSEFLRNHWKRVD